MLYNKVASIAGYRADPLPVSGYTVWLDADTHFESYLNGQHISGNVTLGGSAAAVMEPYGFSNVIIDNARNSKRGIQFSGGAQFGARIVGVDTSVIYGGDTQNNQYSVYAAFTMGSVRTVADIFVEYSTGYHGGILLDCAGGSGIVRAKNSDGGNLSIVSSYSTADVDTHYVVGTRNDGVAPLFRADDYASTTQTTNTGSNQNRTSNWHIGLSATLQPYYATVYEIAVFPFTLSDVQHTAMMSYLNDRWGPVGTT